MSAEGAARTLAPPPIFVGGTGGAAARRSSACCWQVRPDYAVIPVEAKFHCSPTGLPSVLCDTQTPEHFAERMLAEWFPHPPGGDERLAAFIDREALEGALARFLADCAEDPGSAASRGLVREIFGGYAQAQGRHGWVEMTPMNAMWVSAPCLAQLFPSCAS